MVNIVPKSAKILRSKDKKRAQLLFQVEGSVVPCCFEAKEPIGDLSNKELIDFLGDLAEFTPEQIAQITLSTTAFDVSSGKSEQPARVEVDNVPAKDA